MKTADDEFGCGFRSPLLMRISPFRGMVKGARVVGATYWFYWDSPDSPAFSTPPTDYPG
jgi:hypothetical protein